MLEKMNLSCKVVISGILCILVFAVWSGVADGAEKTPVTRYWMSVSTEKGGFPGMPSGGMTGMIGAMMGVGDGGGSAKKLRLQVNSPKSPPAAPEATHDIPPGQNMGPTLPLLTPEPTGPGRTEPAERAERPQEKMEKPKMRMLVYWGCSETVRPGQPYVMDTEKMSPAEFGRGLQGTRVSMQNPPSARSGWAYADWPNRRDSKRVPADSSLVGKHFVHGNYLPDINFAIDTGHDFMAPVEFTSTKGGAAESFEFQWNAIPTATGYFATAVGHDEKTGTMIIWSSSDVREAGYSLMDFLPDADVRRLVKEKVVLEPSTTRCVVPKGIFKDARGAMIQFIAYGDELNISYPPRPKDPVWAVKVRRKSTSMLPLMEMAAGAPGKESGGEGAAPPPEKKEDEGITPGKLLKGIFKW